MNILRLDNVHKIMTEIKITDQASNTIIIFLERHVYIITSHSFLFIFKFYQAKPIHKSIDDL